MITIILLTANTIVLLYNGYCFIKGKKEADTYTEFQATSKSLSFVAETTHLIPLNFLMATINVVMML
jgi:hypothetical protein